MSNVIQFSPKPKAPVNEDAPAIDAGEVAMMVSQSAAMQVISTLAFYANQGFDHGAKARNAVGALQELLNPRGQPPAVA